MFFPRPGPTGPILSAPPFNVPLPVGGGNWTSRLVGGGIFLVGQNPRHGWVSVHDPHDEFDAPNTTGISGTVVNEPHTSHSDLPFMHPFGNDFEFHLAPDPAYFDLIGPTMKDEYLESANTANTEFGLNVPGVIGMEMDSGLVPGEFQAKKGDRACLFGRLIVDAGHKDFHTEIHPPLVMTTARPTRSAQQHANSPTFDATTVQIITRPYLVSQEFDHGGLFNHLLVQVGEAEINPFSRIDAHPRLMPKPFKGINNCIFDIRPPTPRRAFGDQLILESVITHRKGVGLGIFKHPEEADAVRVVVTLAEDSYVSPPAPPAHDRTVSRAELLEGGGFWVAVLKASLFTTAVLSQPHMLAVVERGFPSHTFEIPRAISPGHENSRTRQRVTELPGVPTNIDDKQHFPMFGTLKLEWQREVGPAGDPDQPTKPT